MRIQMKVKQKLKMTLLSDTIFGNGMNIPGGENISLCTDSFGFPYLKASVFKGLFREELENILSYRGIKGLQRENILERLLGTPGRNLEPEQEKILFSDFILSPALKKIVLSETSNKQEILDAISYHRTFTQLTDGMTKEGSLRYFRCLKKGLVFHGTILYEQEKLMQMETLIQENAPFQEPDLLSQTLSFIKWAGMMKTRGFGKVLLEKEE